jgi:hypothetical protein
MKKWQAFVAEHMQTEVIDDNTIKVSNVAYDSDNNYYDDIVKRNEFGTYTVEMYNSNTGELDCTFESETIKDYLGY